MKKIHILIDREYIRRVLIFFSVTNLDNQVPTLEACLGNVFDSSEFKTTNETFIAKYYV